jgi:hypothetical protein
MIVGEAVLVPVKDNVADMECIYTLNEVGAFIWQKLGAPGTQAELQSALVSEYDADPAIIAADLEGFLGEMTTIGAIRKV